jgi:heme exporter protein B
MPYFRAVAAIIRKDLTIELRARESLALMLLFGVMTVVLMNFGLRLRIESMRPLAPVVLWLAIALAGTLGLNRSMASEQANGALDNLLLAPHDPGYVFVGKALANALLMTITGLILLLLLAVLFDERILSAGVALSVLLGSLAYAGVGTLAAMLSSATRSRDSMLPILLFPLLLPLLVAAVQASAGFVDGVSFADYGPWLGVMTAYGVIFWAAGTLLFEHMLD